MWFLPGSRISAHDLYVSPFSLATIIAHKNFYAPGYKRYEVMNRMAIFYAAASLSGAFSGLLAFAIQHMEGIAGRHGWQWIFILEGLVPVSVSFVLYFILPDSPETAKFLTKHEKEFLVNRLALETGSGHGRVTNSDRIQLHHVIAAFKEWKIWCAVVCFWANTIGTYG